MAETVEEIILIKKKVASHGGHHGGAWKVAYADFVTAMMSLFIVLWLISSNDAVKNSVASYFQDPQGTAKLAGSANRGDGNSLPLERSDMKSLREKLQQAVQRLPRFERLKDQVDISSSQEGIRIELLESEGGTFFRSGSAVPTPVLASFLKAVSTELGKIPNRISVEGHTDSKPYSGEGGYTNWELSADRANAARRMMEASGTTPNQIAQVRGFADQMPRRHRRPEDPSNRRISIIVEPFTPTAASAPEPEPAKLQQKAVEANVPAKVEGKRITGWKPAGKAWLLQRFTRFWPRRRPAE